MNEETRRLSAIMFTDVVGYSRLMAEDESRAMAVLRDLRQILTPLIAEWRGTLHKEIGDGTLSSFASAVDAVKCARAIQQAVGEQPHIELRIGLHVGDVITEAGDVHGDGVNIAARIEPLAPPGGIALSDTICMQIRGKVDLPLRSIGTPMLKNIGLPMEVFVCDLADAATSTPSEQSPPRGLVRVWSRLRSNRVLQWTAAYTALAFAVLQGIVLLGELFGAPALLSRLAAVLLGWGIPASMIVAWFHGTPGRQPPVRHEIALLGVLAMMTTATLGWQIWSAPANDAAPARTSRQLAGTEAQASATLVVVLPFENQGGLAEDAYLSEGFSDELRDQLSRVKGLRVIARGSSIAFRGRSLDARTIATELGVSSVVEGTLRKEGDRLRLAVRLVDGTDGAQRWSESYDRSTTSMLVVQQEVALAAVRAILPQIADAEVPQLPWQSSVHELMLLARNHAQNAVQPHDQQRVIELYQQVIERDPRSAIAHARLGRALLLGGADPATAEQHMRRAIALDSELAEGYANLGFLLWSQVRKGAGEMLRRAYELNPNDAQVLQQYAHYAHLAKTTDWTPDYFLRVRELDPMSLQANADVAWFYALSSDQTEVAKATALIEHRFPDANGRQALARIADTAGQLDEAIAWAREVLRLDAHRDDAIQDLAERYARLGMIEESRELLPEPPLRVLFWERRYQDIVARMEMRDLDEANFDELGTLAFALQALGRDAEAVPVLRGMGLPEITTDGELRRWASLHHLVTLIGSLQATGDVQEARRLAIWLSDFVERDFVPGVSNTHKLTGWGELYWYACANTILGKRDVALEAFENSAGSSNLAWMPLLEDSACFRSLREDPRHKAAVTRLEARYAEQRARLPRTLARHGIEDALPPVSAAAMATLPPPADSGTP